MKYYIEAYDIHDRQILGNMDGQSVLNCRDYRRTDHYKMLHALPARNVRYFAVTDYDGKVFERVLNTPRVGASWHLPV